MRERLDATVEQEQIYLQLIASYTGFDKGIIDGDVDGLLRAETSKPIAFRMGIDCLPFAIVHVQYIGGASCS